MNIRTALKSVGMGILVMAVGSIALSQEKTGLPEFFGFYAISDGQNIAIYEGQGAEGTKTARLTNQFRIGYNRFWQKVVQADSNTNPNVFGLNTGVTDPINFGLPEIRIGGFSTSHQLGGKEAWPLYT